jgi:hypothetical protein
MLAYEDEARLVAFGSADARPLMDSRSYEPTPHKSVDYRAFKRGFQASRNQSQSLYMALTK